VASTGIIGVELERDPILDGIERAVAGLSEEGGGDFSTAILTSDRGPKRACMEIAMPSGPVVLSAQAKGAGMLAPDFATMLCFVETDAGLDSETLARMLRATVARSFERVTVDGQLSTNDSVFAIASGSSGPRVEPGSAEEGALTAALDALLRQLAIEMVADGEGAARVARLRVHGPAKAVDAVASGVANSPLVKCALHGGDPNWGRVLQAAGQALVDATDEIDLAIEGVAVARRGEDVRLADADRRRLEEAMRGAEVEMTVGLPGADTGTAEAEIFFCDLSPEYVTFNSAYST
jgi:glutamate N-acetyltransferase/amino-acid N-acetyltransferase